MAPAAFVDLWVKAGSDGIRLGGDPVCQQIFMAMILKSESDDGLKFNVKTVNPAKPPPEFKDADLRHAPAIQHDDVSIEHPDDIIEYIDKTFPYPSLKYSDTEADGATADLFSKFCFYIKEVNKDSKGLEQELHRIDQFLEGTEHKYLAGDRPTHLDCRMLPKLHAIRVACAALKDFTIPDHMKHLWSYLKRAYALDAFKKSCPSDQEIILYWADRPDTPNLSSNKRAQLYRQNTEYSLTVPDGI
uniref:GST C-terminal domain-containing protein n=1 Tax=Plectus sambesii TaxID=2011161 RepID=A0A914UPL2_9BILA